MVSVIDSPVSSTLKSSSHLSSSERLVRFLEKSNLHKKDFSEMIGVTLSYVYSLIDSNSKFPSRITTLERIAIVMDALPQSFPEYQVEDEPKPVDFGIQYLKECQQALGITNIQLLKKFPRNKRLEIVDMWRGALPLPLDWNKLSSIATALEISEDAVYPYWQARLQQHLIQGGIDPLANMGLMTALFQGIKQYLKV
jgi:transcriptional regulator with XRE-family HTH domain